MESTKNLQILPTKHSHIFRVKLNLEMQTRFIGSLDTAGDGTFLSHRKLKHIFQKYGGENGSLGINHSLLTDESIPFKWIVIDFESRKLVTSRLYFLTHGKCFKFGNKGFELQCLLPIAEFGIDKAEQYENSLSKQVSLFGEVA